jgi:hypothetical protein
MLYRLFVAIGVILVILGILKFVGVISLVSAGAVALLVVGLLVIVGAHILFGPTGNGYYSRRRL